METELETTKNETKQRESLCCHGYMSLFVTIIKQYQASILLVNIW